MVTIPTVSRPAPSVVDTEQWAQILVTTTRLASRPGSVGSVNVAIVSLLSVVLAALLAMPWWIFRMMDSLRKELTGKIEESHAKIDALQASTDAKFADLETRTDAKFADLEAKLTARIDMLEAGTNARFADLETKLTSKIDGLRSDITKLSERVARIEGYLFGIEPPAPDGPAPEDGTDRPEPPTA